MSFEYFIGRRYLRAKQKQAFVSLITILSIAGVMVGVMALIVVIAVMNGFDADLKARILVWPCYGGSGKNPRCRSRDTLYYYPGDAALKIRRYRSCG
jgi:hypothetical protein